MYAIINCAGEVRISPYLEDPWEVEMKPQGLLKCSYPRIIEVFGRPNSWLPEDALVAMDEWRVYTPDGPAEFFWSDWDDMAEGKAVFKVVAETKKPYQWMKKALGLDAKPQ